MNKDKKNNPSHRKQNDSYGHVLKYTGLFGGVQGLKIIVDIVRNKLAAVLLHQVGLGLNAQYMNSADVANSFTNFGIGFSAVQRLSELYEQGDEEQMRLYVGVIRTWSLLSALAGIVLCVLLSMFAQQMLYPDGNPSMFNMVLLCLFVASLPMEVGECSILKGTRKLQQMAGVEVVVALSTLLLTIPVYYLMGLHGIVLALALGGWAKVLIHMYVSCRLFRYRVHPFSPTVIRAGRTLIARGIPYMLTAVLGSLTTMALFQYCLNGTDAEIGLYKSAYNLMVTYTGLVFIAIGTDFFPRLSSVNHDRERMNHAINQQIDVTILLITPLLILFVLFMAWVMRLLYSSEFLPAVTMAQCAVFYMFFRAVTTPMAYTSLAKGESLMYLTVEAIYNVVFIGLMYYGYHHFGLTGAGISLSLAALFDMLLIGSVYGRRYKFDMRLSTVRLILVQGALLIAVVLASVSGYKWLKYGVGLSALWASIAYSCSILRQDTAFVDSLRQRIRKKFR